MRRYKSRKKKKPQLNEEERGLLKASAKAHKEILVYLKEQELKGPLKDLLNDVKHREFLKPRMDIIHSARAIALNKKYEIMEASVDVGLRTSKYGNRTTQWKRKKALEEKRKEEVFDYPLGLEDSLKESYRILFKKHIASGMPRELAQKLTLEGLQK